MKQSLEELVEEYNGIIKDMEHRASHSNLSPSEQAVLELGVLLRPIAGMLAYMADSLGTIATKVRAW